MLKLFYSYLRKRAFSAYRYIILQIYHKKINKKNYGNIILLSMPFLC
jgi:hypothetical protein